MTPGTRGQGRPCPPLLKGDHELTAERFKSRKQATKFMDTAHKHGRTVLKEKQRRKALHVFDSATGRGRFKAD